MTLVYVEGLGEAGRVPAIATTLTPDQVARLVCEAIDGAGAAETFVLLPYRTKTARVRADKIIAAVEQ